MPAEGSQKTNSSNLYLVTFLATLFLLLFVSFTIVLRSYLLRRRYQSQVDHALAQGIVLTPRTPGSRKKRYGLPPRLYENWITPLHVSGLSGCQLEKGTPVPDGRWVDMLPLTVQTVVVKRRTRESMLSPTSSPLTTQSPDGHLLLTGVRFASPDAETQPQGRLESFLSRFSRPSAPPAQTQIAFPRPTGSETPTNAATPRERRESQSNWRTIVTPSPSLAMAGAVDAASATVRVRSLSTPGDRRSRRLSMPAPLPTALPASNSNNNSGTSTPNGRSGLLSVFRGRRNSTIAATSPPAPSPPPQSEREVLSSIARALDFEYPSWPPPSSSSTPAPASSASTPTNRTRARININTNVPNPSTAPSPGGLASAATPTLMTAVTPVVTSPTALGAISKSRIRTEMLQISVLVAMPDLRTSSLFGDAGVVKKGAKRGGEEESRHRKTKRRKSAEVDDEDEVVEVPGDDDSSSSDCDDLEEEDDEEQAPLPELVLGVTRLTYRYGNTLITPTSAAAGSPAFVIPSSPPPPPPATAPLPIPAQVGREDAPQLNGLRRLTHE